MLFFGVLRVRSRPPEPVKIRSTFTLCACKTYKTHLTPSYRCVFVLCVDAKDCSDQIHSLVCARARAFFLGCICNAQNKCTKSQRQEKWMNMYYHQNIHWLWSFPLVGVFFYSILSVSYDMLTPFCHDARAHFKGAKLRKFSTQTIFINVKTASVLNRVAIFAITIQMHTIMHNNNAPAVRVQKTTENVSNPNANAKKI